MNTQEGGQSKRVTEEDRDTDTEGRYEKKFSIINQYALLIVYGF